MKNINLLLCAVAIIASANSFAMESPAKEYAKVGIKATKPDVAITAQSIAAQQEMFFKTYGITPQELVRILNIRADLRQKYADFAIKKMDRFKDIKNEVERRSKIAGKIIRKYIKNSDLYTELMKEAEKKDLYKNYKKEILDFIKKSKGSNIEMNKTHVKFPAKYNYTGRKNKDGKKVVAVKKQTVKTMPAKAGRKPVIIKETEIDIWEVEPAVQPMVKKPMAPIAKTLPTAKIAQNLPAPRPGEGPRPIKPMPIEPELELMARQDDDTYQVEDGNIMPAPRPRPYPRDPGMVAQAGEQFNNEAECEVANMDDRRPSPRPRPQQDPDAITNYEQFQSQKDNETENTVADDYAYPEYDCNYNCSMTSQEDENAQEEMDDSENPYDGKEPDTK